MGATTPGVTSESTKPEGRWSRRSFLAAWAGVPLFAGPASGAVRGSHVYFHDSVRATVWAYLVDSEGRLFRPPGMPYAAQNGAMERAGPLQTLAFTPDGRWALASGQQGLTWFARRRDGALERFGDPVGPGALERVAIGRIGSRTLVFASQGTRLHGFRVRRLTELVELRDSPWDFSAQVTGLAIRGNQLAAALQPDNTLVFWRLNGNGSFTPAPSSPYSTLESPLSAVFSADGKSLYTGGGTTPAVAGHGVVRRTGELEPVTGSPFVSASATRFELGVQAAGAVVVAGTETALQVFGRDRTGELRALLAGNPGIGGISGFVPTFDGQYLVSAHPTERRFECSRIDPESGFLNPISFRFDTPGGTTGAVALPA